MAGSGVVRLDFIAKSLIPRQHPSEPNELGGEWRQWKLLNYQKPAPTADLSHLQILTNSP